MGSGISNAERHDKLERLRKALPAFPDDSTVALPPPEKHHRDVYVIPPREGESSLDRELRLASARGAIQKQANDRTMAKRQYDEDVKDALLIGTHLIGKMADILALIKQEGNHKGITRYHACLEMYRSWDDASCITSVPFPKTLSRWVRDVWHLNTTLVSFRGVQSARNSYIDMTFDWTLREC